MRAVIILAGYFAAGAFAALAGLVLFLALFSALAYALRQLQ